MRYSLIGTEIEQQSKHTGTIFFIIESRFEELDSDIALTACEALKYSSTQTLDENGTEFLVPPELENALDQHS
jgi:hypothetical protein